VADRGDPLPRRRRVGLTATPEGEAPEPVEARHEKGARRLVITWSDGHVSPYPLDYLRSWCPCASCQGHDPVARYLNLTSQELTRVEGVGNYALGATWADGHDTGIYSFRWLRRICPCAECGGGRRDPL
jgi:DUF971 family protein